MKTFGQYERRVDQSEEPTKKSRKLPFSDKKLLKSHCLLPAQHHTADRHSFKDQLGNIVEHLAAEEPKPELNKREHWT